MEVEVCHVVEAGTNTPKPKAKKKAAPASKKRKREAIDEVIPDSEGEEELAIIDWSQLDPTPPSPVKNPAKDDPVVQRDPTTPSTPRKRLRSIVEVVITSTPPRSLTKRQQLSPEV